MARDKRNGGKVGEVWSVWLFQTPKQTKKKKPKQTKMKKQLKRLPKKKKKHNKIQQGGIFSPSSCFHSSGFAFILEEKKLQEGDYWKGGFFGKAMETTFPWVGSLLGVKDFSGKEELILQSTEAGSS